ncbi:HNH endonuclease signature motif containing protein [Ornithinibacillus sp. JPR2-1]|uniref:HNH endonuclease signature motif containing protein n=1 Tax=Ornithinibacillus sp. JPR2-1 TaxID=2094019 RepID=UPI0031D68BAD
MIKEIHEFICEVAPGKYNDEIAQLVNKKFGTSYTAEYIRSYKSRHKIKSNVPKRRVKDDEGLFTKEQKEFIQKHVKGLRNQELADLVNEKFNLSITALQMKNWKRNHGLSSGLKGSEGLTPPNKGTKGLHNVGGNKTSFKKGQKPANYKPVGSERVDNDGYLLVKVQEDGPWNKRWRHKHKILWEEVNGPVPRGYKLIFADGNKENITLENLILVSNRQLLTMNRNSLIQGDAELTKTGIVIADLMNKITDRKRK